MTISRKKFKIYCDIQKNRFLYIPKGNDLSNKKIIKLAKEEYNSELTKKELTEIRLNFEYLTFKYIN